MSSAEPAVACSLPVGSLGQHVAHERRPALARAKNTARAEARRRSRAESRLTSDGSAEEAVETAPPAEEPRRPLFTPPNVLQDIRQLPAIFRERKLLWLPVALLLVGFGLTYLAYLNQIPAELLGPAELFIQFFFVPYGLFTFFIAGFLAPRASYLIGFLLGLLNGLLWAILLFVGTTLPTTSPDPAQPVGDPATAAGQVVLVAVLYGTLAAAFAAWYRNFLRQMQERGKQRRADREAQERAKRRDERRAARRPG